ncbi:polyketide synthase [Aspergillus avenaceus]|uniref:Polyketide synthase n=1 Tax=Aspergillus avenaceus TaxID=36643 RepID=A0A5N6U6A4_ASPAV|nr:polyketide synthase [Aspergillus avenaceus]
MSDPSSVHTRLCADCDAPTPTDDVPDVGDPAVVPFPIAIVGMAMRLPGGVNCGKKFWEFLINKKDGLCKVPEDRYNIDAFYHDSTQGHIPGTIRTQNGYFLQQDISQVDAGFFGMSKIEAAKLDPQQRMLLEIVWECMENGGQTQWCGKDIGCYVGVYGEDWLDLQSRDPQGNDRYRVIAAGDFAIANRVSYEFDLGGPSITFRTGCSSSLVGLHEACQALYSGECSSAVVAGTNLIITPTMTTSMSDNMVISPSGICRTFDAKADGYGRGEAVNAIFIKPLDAALKDGDPVRAVIRSTAVNCDGKTPGITTPGSLAQERLVRRAYRKAQIDDLSRTGFFECHGTGTTVGDTAETSVVATIFGRHGIHMGAVKPNVGHSEGASGITSVIKSVLALEHKIIPPNVYFEQPNPNIPFIDAKLQVPIEATPWPSSRHERISVNSFGIGGTNAHLILDSTASILEMQEADLSSHRATSLLLISAKTSSSLEGNIEKIKDYLETNNVSPADLAYTLALRREHMAQRAFATVEEDGTIMPFEKSQIDVQNLTFVFTGQGAQWPGMAKELVLKSDNFRQNISYLDRVLQQLKPAPRWSIENELLECRDSSQMMDPRFAQPLCTAIQIALVSLLRDWGVMPASVVGHSSGEIAAAFACGAISAASAITIAYYRGDAMKSARSDGAMAAVSLGSGDIEPYLRDGVVVACENSPKSVTLSGDREALDILMKTLEDEEVFCRRLAVNVAYHSHHMKELGSKFEESIRGHVSHNQSMIPLFSTLTGDIIKDPKVFTSTYWKRNLESPVLFNSAIRKILDLNAQSQVFFEIGPHSALSSPLRQAFSGSGDKKISYIPTLVRDHEQWSCILVAIGRLYIHGIPVDLQNIIAPARVLTDLPPYHWDHTERFWSETRLAHDWRLQKAPKHELLGCRTLESTDTEPSWRNLLLVDDVLWLLDHKLSGVVVFPGAGYVAMVGEAIHQISGCEDFSLRNVFMKNALVLEQIEPTPIEIITNLRPVKLTDDVDSIWYDFTISAYHNGQWRKHCQGQIRPGPDCALEKPTILPKPRPICSDTWYNALQGRGLEYGSQFRGLSRITTSPSSTEATATVNDTEDHHQSSHYTLHPIIIDECLQLLSVAATSGIPRRMTKLCIPTAFESLYIAKGRDTMSLGASCDMSGNLMNGSACLMSDDQIILSLSGGKFFGISDSAISDGAAPLASTLEWKPHIDFCSLEDLFPPIPSNLYPGRVMAKMTKLMVLQTYHETKSLRPTQSHMRKYRDWIMSEYHKICVEDPDIILETEGNSAFDAEVCKRHIQEIMENEKHPIAAVTFQLARKILQMIHSLFNGTVSGLEVLMEDDSIPSMYEYIASITNWSSFLSALSHTKPSLRILEIGAGTGGNTSVTLKRLMALSPSSGRMYSRYTFTDISAGFISQAKERFKEFPAVDYLTLDISQDPLEQGFEAGGYDLIIACNVLHATPNISESLHNVRKLIAPHGWLLLQELCHITPIFDYIMGILPSWWVAEDGREKPYISPEKWHQELVNAGFTGADIVRYDNDMPYHFNANIASRPQAPEQAIGKVHLLYDGTITGWSRSLEQTLLSNGFSVKWLKFDEIPSTVSNVISLLDLECPFFNDISAPRFSIFQRFTQAVNGLCLWLTRPTQLVGGDPDPRYGLTLGVMRTLGKETSQNIATLEVDCVDESATKSVLEIYQLLQKQQCELGDTLEHRDYEFVLNSGAIHVCRFQWSTLDNAMNTLEDAEPRILDIKCPGMLDSLTWALAGQSTPMKDTDIEMDIKFVGLNFRDIMVSMGLLGDTREIGLEASGIVKRVGPAVTDIQVGDRISTFGKGLFRTSKVLPACDCMVLPERLSLEDAASGSGVFTTAIYSLMHCGNLQKGQTVLIHSACGGVGLAAIQICRLIGAEIFATVSSEDKIQHLTEILKIPRNHIFDSRSTSFLQGIRKATNNKGVDIVLNSLSGELLHASWKCVAPFGKLIELGKRDFLGHAKLDMDLFIENRSYIGVDLLRVGEKRPELLQRLMEQFSQYTHNGSIHPIRPVHVYEATDITQAFRYLQSGKNTGKTVIHMPDDPSTIPVSRLHENGVLFRPDASYLLVGGFGGLGRAVITWMVEKGARYLVIMSRSGHQTPENHAFVEDLRNQGDIHVSTVAGNVANMEDVREAVTTAAKPVAGIFQMSMFLQDESFNKMTYEEWQQCLAPKVQGTWNLHHAVEGMSLDFFVLFSSLTGICGFAGQANYAAANTFLDAFAKYRHAHGLPASVIDIGFMGDIGYASEHAQRTLQFSRSISFQILEERDLLHAVELAVLYGPRQLALGLGTTKPLSEIGMDPLWGRDARFSAWNNVMVESEEKTTGKDEELKRLVMSIEHEPSLLYEQSTEDKITYELGRMVASHMSHPDDLGLEELANITIDSLMAIEIRGWFRRHLKVEVPLVEISNSGTVRGLSQTTIRILKEKHHRGGLGQAKEALKSSMTSDTEFQDQAELDLCLRDKDLGGDIHPLGGQIPEWHNPSEGRVFLTGATGYLGAFFLVLLADLPYVKEIACLVRAPDDPSGRSRLEQTLARYGLPFDILSKVVVVPGDVTEFNLGLEEDKYQELARWSSVVFHFAAYSNYALPYSAHRDINVCGVINTLRFANTARSKALQFVSSISACGISGHLSGELILEDQQPPFELEYFKQHIGYTQSKVVAESVIWNALSNGVPITIHRPGLVSGHSVTGVSKSEDIVNRLIANSIRIGCYPTAPEGLNQLIPVDFVCSAILRISLSNQNTGHAFNVVQPDQSQNISWTQIFDTLSQLASPPLRCVTLNEWIDIFMQHGDERARAGGDILRERLKESIVWWGRDKGTVATCETANLRRAIAGFPEPLEAQSMAELLKVYFPVWKKQA